MKKGLGMLEQTCTLCGGAVLAVQEVTEYWTFINTEDGIDLQDMVEAYSENVSFVCDTCDTHVTSEGKPIEEQKG